MIPGRAVANRTVMKHALASLAGLVSVATAFGGGGCSSSTTCSADNTGTYVCDAFASAYPYDYAYYDPYYLSVWGYYPYYVDTYYDPYGYTYVYQASSVPVPQADPTNGSNVPELLDKAHRAANAVDVGVRAALDPIKELMQTYLKYPPRKLQSEGYAGPVTITQYQRFEYLREQLAKDGFNIGLPTGN